MDVISPLNIEKVVYGGEGLARHDGKVIFIPFTIKGEKVSAKITKSKKNHSFADCIRIIESNESRIKPQCPHFGFCGGCQFQHMNYDMQLETKLDILKENLGLFVPKESIKIISLKDNIWEYREHIKLSYQQGRLGYHGMADKDVFDLKACPIFSNMLEMLLDALKIHLEHAVVNHAEIRLLKAGDEFIAAIKIDHGDVSVLSKLVTVFKGVSIIAGNNRHDFGNCHHSQNYLSYVFETDIWSFMQNHRLMAELLYKFVIDLIPSNSSTVLDLYCGCGILSILSAKKGVRNVIGIELNPSSIACAKKNQISNGLDHIQFYASPSEHVHKYVKGPIDFAIVNPPREGLSPDMLKEIVKLDATLSCYISCNPTTLNRDLKALVKEGYEVVSCTGFDLFPQTTHLETVCVIKKR